MAKITTEFDIDDAGWKIRQSLGSPAQGPGENTQLKYQESGGNTTTEPDPDGCIEFTDATGGTAYFSAPAEYLGDQSDKEYIEYSLFITNADPLDNDITNDIIIRGANGQSLIYDLPTPTLENTWITLHADFKDGNWKNSAGLPATPEEIAAVLADVTDLLIAGEYSTAPGDVTHLDSVTFAPCFAAGTHIRTKDGEMDVAEIVAGHEVYTIDSGFQTVRWAGNFKVDAEGLKENPKLYPVRIVAGALGNGMPKNDLLVSRQHRILVSSKIALRMFGNKDVLVPAIALTDLPGVYVDESVTEVTYYHLLLDNHEILVAEGSPSESFYVGETALYALTEEALEEIQTIFPNILKEVDMNGFARTALTTKKAKALLMRHSKNNVSVVQS